MKFLEIVMPFFSQMQLLKGQEIQKYNWILSKCIWKTAHFDANFMKIGFLLLKILQFYIFKMAANWNKH